VLTGFRGQGIDEYISNNGGILTSSVSKNTDLLVYADGETQSSKYLKAIELNIQTISLSEFKNKYKIK
jgi:NAD-dependent DNA ligase